MIRRIWNYALLFAALYLLTVQAAALPQGSVRVMTRGGTVALYRVGVFEDNHFRLLDVYGGKTVSFDETLSGELAAGLASQARNGYVKAADLNGEVVFAGLDPGLYLVVHRSTPQGYEPFDPFLVSLPWDGDQWDVNLEPEPEGIQPVTGDTDHPEEWVVIMLLCAAGILWCIWRGGKELKQI